MPARLKRRIAALERKAANHAGRAGPSVVYVGADETAEQAFVRAVAEGITGGVLVVPAPMTAERFAEVAPVQQRELMAECLRLANSPTAVH